MKKLVLLFVVIAVCYGCDKKEYAVECDAFYVWEFVVENKTNDKEIKIDTDYPLGPYANHYVLTPNKGDVIMDIGTLGGCDAKGVMPDIIKDVVETFHIGYGEEYPFFMIIDGESVSQDIWLPKYWSFEAGLYDSTYTLTVTDELLEQLAEKEE